MARQRWARPLSYVVALVALLVGGGMALGFFQVSIDKLLLIAVPVLVGGFLGSYYSKPSSRDLHPGDQGQDVRRPTKVQ